MNNKWPAAERSFQARLWSENTGPRCLPIPGVGVFGEHRDLLSSPFMCGIIGRLFFRRFSGPDCLSGLLERRRNNRFSPFKPTFERPQSFSRVLGLKETCRWKGEEGEGSNELRIRVSPESNTPAATLGLHTGSDRLPHTCFSTAAGSYYRLLLGICGFTLGLWSTVAKSLHHFGAGNPSRDSRDPG